MSGGSYDYLFVRDADEIFSRSEELRKMADRLAALGYAQDAAQETEDLICIMRQYEVRANTRIRRLSGVWKAVEWWDSGDSGEDGLIKALADYRGEGE